MAGLNSRKAPRWTRGYLRRFDWRGLLRFGPFRWADVAPGRAVRVAVGVAVPLGLGAATGHLEYGAFASLGAMPAGFASFQGETRTRVAAVVAASAGMAVSTFVGGTAAAAAPWLPVAVVIVWGYLTGLAACLGVRQSVAVIQWPVALLIAVGIPLGPADAALRAGLVLAGGLFQAILVTVSWALRRGDPERATLAASYRRLAAYASELAAGRTGPPPSAAFPAAARLADPNPLLPQAIRLAYVDLLERAERIRASLATVGVYTVTDPAASRFAATAAQALDVIAGALSARPPDSADRLRELDRIATEQNVPPDAGWHWAAALRGQLRAVSGTLARVDAVDAAPGNDTPSGSSAPATEAGIKRAASTLRANLNPAGVIGHHALRLAVVAGLAEALVQTTDLFEGRWAVLTIFLVLKPDYHSTVSRSVHRVLGTAAGALLGAAVLELAHPGLAGLIVASTIAIAAAYGLFEVTYLLYTSFLTIYILILLNILGLAPETTAAARLTDTAVGAVLALIAYFVWPTWQGRTGHEQFARLIEADGQYTAALLRALAHPARLDPTELRNLQAAARRARSDAESTTAALVDEPAHPPLTPAGARTLIAAATRLAHAELSLHALVTAHVRVAGPEADRTTVTERLHRLATSLGTTMTSVACDLRSLRASNSTLPLLRHLQPDLSDQAAPPDGRILHIADRLVKVAERLETIVRTAPVRHDSSFRGVAPRTPGEASINARPEQPATR